MLKYLVLSASVLVLLTGASQAMPGAQAHHLSIKPGAEQPFVSKVDFHKGLKKLKNVFKGGNKTSGVAKSSPNFKGSAPSARPKGSSSSSSAASAPSRPTRTQQFNFPSQADTVQPSWLSKTIKRAPTVQRTPAEKTAMLDNLNKPGGRGMFYTEKGGFRTLPGGNKVFFRPDGTYRVDPNDVRLPTNIERLQIDAVSRGDVKFNFRDTDNGVLRLENRRGQEVYLRYDNTFVPKGGVPTKPARNLKPNRSNTAVASTRPLDATDNIPAAALPPSTYDSSAAAARLQPQDGYTLPGAPAQLPQVRYDNALPGNGQLPQVRYDNGFPADANAGGGLPSGNAYEQPNSAFN